jgi:hypothetical protein
VTWWRRTLSLPLRMTNLGNAPIQVAVQGRAGTDSLVFRPGLADVPCTVQPGQQVRTVMALTARRLPILGARPCSFGLRAVDQEGRVLQQLRQTVELRPLLGWSRSPAFVAGRFVAPDFRADTIGDSSCIPCSPCTGSDCRDA